MRGQPGPLGTPNPAAASDARARRYHTHNQLTSPPPSFLPLHTQDAALARDLSTQSGALTGRFAGGSSAGVQGYAYQNAQGP